MVTEPAVDYWTRFYSKVEKTDGCWLWVGARGGNGYGVFAVGGDLVKAHRFAYLLERGPIRAGLRVLHRCDVRRCVNPDHLFLGTQSDNLRDMVAKGRHRPNPRRGERHHGARLTTADVIAIRASTDSRKVLRERYGVSKGAIAAILARRIWAHV